MTAKALIITRSDLERANICNANIELFEETFGQSVKITKINIEKALSKSFDFEHLYRLLKNQDSKFEFQSETQRQNAIWSDLCMRDTPQHSRCEMHKAGIKRPLLMKFIELYKKEHVNGSKKVHGSSGR